MKIRTIFLVVSLTIVVLFASLVMAGRNRKDDLYRALGNLAQVVHLIHTRYVDPVNLGALGEGLDAGLVESADPRAAVLDDSEVAAYQTLLKNPPPFGIVLGLRLGTAAVRQALPGSPAAEAGLKEWEILEEVQGLPTRGMPLWRVRLLLASHVKAGKKIEMTVFGRNIEKHRKVELTPAPWSPSVATSSMDDGVQVVTITSLPRGAAGKIRAILGHGPLVLDLRHLVWGREDQAIAVADFFTSQGVLGIWKGRRAGSTTFQAHPAALPVERPIVLVGGDTEGVGEILAAALNRAGCTVVGTPTEAHADHMMLIREKGLTLLLPVSRWLASNGKPIDADGVVIDEKVDLAGAKKGSDPVLDRGLKLARGIRAKAA
ncbi:MAG: hypothetical protein GXP48_01255 [Acidobacteria bacterium]|nr:hypothetical protein [Acidobacteriota bacterium]